MSACVPVMSSPLITTDRRWRDSQAFVLRLDSRFSELTNSGLGIKLRRTIRNLMREGKATMELRALDRPPSLTGVEGRDSGPSPPGTDRVATLLEVVGITIFLAILVGAAIVMIRRNRRL